jgi:hypothetical protein
MRNVTMVSAFAGALASMGAIAPFAYANGEVPKEQDCRYMDPQTQARYHCYEAQPGAEAQPGYEYQRERYEAREERRRSRLHVLPNARDFELTAGAGFSDFTGSTLRNISDGGAEWDARFTVGARSIIAFEAGYVGTFNSLETTEGAGPSPQLVSHGVDGDVRINFVPWIVEPYIFAGAGYNHMSVRNAADDPAIAARFNQSDNQLLVPAGAGLAFNLGHFTLDARFTYRAIFNNDLDRLNNDTKLDQYNVAGRLGVIF